MLSQLGEIRRGTQQDRPTRHPLAANSPTIRCVSARTPTSTPRVGSAGSTRPSVDGGGFEYVRDRQAVRRPLAPPDPVSRPLYVVDEGSGFLAGQSLDVSGGSAFP
ncbi:hypothetical protein AB5J49_41210 [Streptomyces sp. R28]|uniref:SDR family oxidoreductase n=1 Tax=Streptomyces sp. R28 TaxID=3238628 RepID=A0AB39QAB2_9ACTN